MDELLSTNKIRKLIPQPLRQTVSRMILNSKEKLFPQTRFSHTYEGKLAMRTYFQCPEMRLLFCEGLPTHNADGMSIVRKTDILLCLIPWVLGEALLRKELSALRQFRLKPNQIVVLCNTQEDLEIVRKFGFQAEYVNHNCWLDQSIFKPRKKIVKDLDAVLNAKPCAWKRAELSAGIHSKAVLTYIPYPEELKRKLGTTEYFECLPSEKVATLLNRAKIGLCLSSEEGACYSSSEYLLSGIPVVSTPSKGGRHIWYTPRNHMICEPTVESVALTVERLIDSDLDGETIRNEHIELAQIFRQRFVQLTYKLGQSRGIEANWASVFQDQYFHKMVTFRATQDVLRELR